MAINVLRLVADAFSSADLELYLVGGALRDHLLERPVHEWDFATNARTNEILSTLEMAGETNHWAQPWSIYRVGEKFGTIGLVANGERAEITTYRSSESYPEGSRKPSVIFGSGIEEDLSRRDFTVNSMAIRAQSFLEGDTSGLIDPYGGRDDLAARLIRSVGAPHERFREDPLRLLRAVRLAAQLGFSVEARTWAAMADRAQLLSSISRERIADELTRMLTGPDPARSLTLLRDSGLLQAAVPDLMILDAMPDHGPRHPMSLWDHTMLVVEGVEPDPISRWAALLHDIGKPETRTFDERGRIRFFQHEEVGAKRAAEVLRSLRRSNELVESVHDLVETHMQVHQYTPEWSDGAIRRLCEKLGPNFAKAIDLAKSDVRGHRETTWGVTGAAELEERAAQLQAQLPSVQSPLTGVVLMERYRRPPGPWIGEIKDRLTEMVRDGALLPGDLERAWEIADAIVGAQTGLRDKH